MFFFNYSKVDLLLLCMHILLQSELNTNMCVLDMVMISVIEKEYGTGKRAEDSETA